MGRLGVFLCLVTCVSFFCRTYAPPGTMGPRTSGPGRLSPSFAYLDVVFASLCSWGGQLAGFPGGMQSRAFTRGAGLVRYCGTTPSPRHSDHGLNKSPGLSDFCYRLS